MSQASASTTRTEVPLPRSSVDALVEQRLAEGDDGGDRFIDFRSDLVARNENRIILTCGGRWDRREKRYSDEPAQSRLVLEVQPAQFRAAEWFAAWFGARRDNRLLYTAEGKPIFSVALVGGRRGGKSDLALRVAISYAVEFPRSIVWIVAPTMPDTPELDRVLEQLMPDEWFTYLGDPWYLYTLANGSEIHIKSSHDPKKLKRGRVDFAVINEAQLHARRTYSMIRPAIADRGGLVVLVANPPDDTKGEWVEEYVEKANAGRFGGRVFILDPKLNPEIVSEALSSLDDEFDERTLRRERDGEFGLPRGDAVFYPFSAPFNVEAAPKGYGITTAFLRRKLNVDSNVLHGMDFQKDPHMVASSLRFWEDPEDPTGDPLTWICTEALVEQGLENDLVDALEAQGYTGADAAVTDASGDWQDAERTKGRSSWDVLRRRGWRKLFMPDENSRRNPPIMERIAVGNSLIRAASGRRKLRIDPRCIQTIRCVRLWENRNGAPNRRSEFAHASDAWTYPAYRLFPRRAGKAGIEYARVERERSERRRDLEEVF